MVPNTKVAHWIPSHLDALFNIYIHIYKIQITYAWTFLNVYTSTNEHLHRFKISRDKLRNLYKLEKCSRVVEYMQIKEGLSLKIINEAQKYTFDIN